MKALQNSFIRGLAGKQFSFNLIKREENIAIYERKAIHSNERCFEVFSIKLVKAGSPLPGGGIVEEDYEQYAPTSIFGKTAFQCQNMRRAEIRFKELLFRNSDIPTIQNKKITIPAGDFTISQFSLFNQISYVQSVNEIKSLINSGKIKLKEAKKIGQGRATNFYCAIS